MSDVIAFAKRLLSCPSVTPDEAGAIAAIEDYLRGKGFRFEVEHTPNGTTNAWITHGSGAPLFVFGGHVDVVSPGELSAWTTPPFEPTERDGKLYARGSSDMKGSVAAAVVSFGRFVDAHPDHKGTIALLITSDEEGDGFEGTMRVVDTLKARGTKIDWCIVGEPSCSKRFGDTIKNGRRGSLNCTLTVYGKQGHVAYPQLAQNPIHLAAPLLVDYTTRIWDEGTKDFAPTSFQISNIHAGEGVVNIIPAKVDITFNIRYNTCWSEAELIAEVEAMARKRGLSVEFAWRRSTSRPFVTEPGAMVRVLSKAIEEVAGVSPTMNTAGGTSDARFISTISGETVEFGPTNATIHSINECVGLDELEGLEEIYFRTLEGLFCPDEAADKRAL